MTKVTMENSKIVELTEEQLGCIAGGRIKPTNHKQKNYSWTEIRKSFADFLKKISPF